MARSYRMQVRTQSRCDVVGAHTHCSSSCLGAGANSSSVTGLAMVSPLGREPMRILINMQFNETQAHYWPVVSAVGSGGSPSRTGFGPWK